MWRRSAFLPILLAYLLGVRQVSAQFKNILHKVTSEIHKAQPNNLQEVLKSTKTKDIVSAIKDKQKQVTDAVKDASGAHAGAPAEATTTTAPPAPQAKDASVADALKGTSIRSIAGNLRDVLQDTTPKELAERLRGSGGEPKELANKILGEDAAHAAGALRDATAKEAMAAVRGGTVRSVSEDAAKSAKAAADGFDAKGMLDAIKGSEADHVKNIAGTKLAQYKDAGVSTINDAMKDPPADTLGKAIGKMIGFVRPPRSGSGGKSEEPGGAEEPAHSSFRSSAAGGAALLFVGLLAVGGGAYGFRRLTKPRPVGVPMLEGESFDMHPMNQMGGSFFGGSGARDLQSQGAASNGFTRF
mmetsp:Transcript_95870/g.271368  ORF Transcript_95870/g.271368 Transcript_95870/m.271368 type:complete len:357 (+) Transcript_95870:119-1189(+)